MSTEGQTKIHFYATLPDIQSAISLPGYPDSGARIKLDLPATDVGAAVLLQQRGAGKLLRVTVEVVDEKESSSIDFSSLGAVLDLDEVETANGTP